MYFVCDKGVGRILEEVDLDLFPKVLYAKRDLFKTLSKLDSGDLKRLEQELGQLFVIVDMGVQVEENIFENKSQNIDIDIETNLKAILRKNIEYKNMRLED